MEKITNMTRQRNPEKEHQPGREQLALLDVK